MEKPGDYGEKEATRRGSAHEYDLQDASPLGGQRALTRALKGRHMQMIAIGELEMAEVDWHLLTESQAELLAQVCSSALEVL